MTDQGRYYSDQTVAELRKRVDGLKRGWKELSEEVEQLKRERDDAEDHYQIAERDGIRWEQECREAWRERDELLKQRVPCVWRLADSDWSVWHTACGRDFQFTVDGPIENEMMYCPYCGGRLETEEEQDD